MRGSMRDQRAEPRTSFHLSGSVKPTRTPAHVAFTRDVSNTGLFFYSDFTPGAGEELTLTFTTPEGGCLMFQGSVVRIEQQSPGAAVGIALVLHSRVMVS